MVCLDNTDTLEGGASVTNVVDYTVHGLVGTTFTNIAQGQLSDTDPSVLYTAGSAISVVSVIFVNTHSAAVTVNLYLDPANAGTPRRMIAEDLSLGIGYSMYFDGARCTVMDAAGGIVSGVNVSDTAYGAGWNGVTAVAPSKNAVYDQMELKAPLASPTFTGTLITPNITVGSGGAGGTFSLLDQAAWTYFMQIHTEAGTTAYTATRTLTFDLQDGDRTIILGGPLTVEDGSSIDQDLTKDSTTAILNGLNLADGILQRPVLKDYGETVYAHGTLSGATNADLENGNVQTFTVGGAFALSLTNPPASGTSGSITFIITNGSSSALTWDTDIDWADGTAPDLTASGVDVVTCETIDAGSIWRCYAAGLDIK